MSTLSSLPTFSLSQESSQYTLSEEGSGFVSSRQASVAHQIKYVPSAVEATFATEHGTSSFASAPSFVPRACAIFSQLASMSSCETVSARLLFLGVNRTHLWVVVQPFPAKNPRPLRELFDSRVVLGVLELPHCVAPSSAFAKACGIRAADVRSFWLFNPLLLFARTGASFCVPRHQLRQTPSSPSRQLTLILSHSLSSCSTSFPPSSSNFSFAAVSYPPGPFALAGTRTLRHRCSARPAAGAYTGSRAHQNQPSSLGMLAEGWWAERKSESAEGAAGPSSCGEKAQEVSSERES